MLQVNPRPAAGPLQLTVDGFVGSLFRLGGGWARSVTNVEKTSAKCMQQLKKSCATRACQG